MAAKPKPGSMDALKALIESKKRKGAPAGAADANGNGVPAAAKKYKTKAEIEAEARRAKEEEELKLVREREEKEAAERRAREKEEEERRAREVEEEAAAEAEVVPLLPREEIFRRLRRLNQPVILFGETDHQRQRRLLQLESVMPADQEYKAVGWSDQFGSDLKNMAKGDDSEKKKKDEATSAAEFLKKLDEAYERKQAEDKLTKEDEIMYTFRRLLKEWEQELAERPEAEKRTAQGKIAAATYKQTLRNITPFFHLLKKKGLAQDILVPTYEIVLMMRAREYVKANDAYLRLSIGNAPWPMGVTMVGIHERSAREKIFSNQVAHILNDETQRKYIQAVKRLMSFAQIKYPNDPSKNIG